MIGFYLCVSLTCPVLLFPNKNEVTLKRNEAGFFHSFKCFPVRSLDFPFLFPGISPYNFSPFHPPFPGKSETLIEELQSELSS